MADVADATQVIAADDVDAAVRSLAATRREYEVLAAFPRLGRHRGLRRKGFRDVRSRPVSGFQSWLVFYRPTLARIEVVRVLHGACDVEAALGG